MGRDLKQATTLVLPACVSGCLWIPPKEWTQTCFPLKSGLTSEVLPMWRVPLVKRYKRKQRNSEEETVPWREREEPKKSFEESINLSTVPIELLFQLLTGKKLLCPGGPCFSISAFKDKGRPTDSAIALDFISFHFQSILASLSQDSWLIFLHYWNKKMTKK